MVSFISDLLLDAGSEGLSSLMVALRVIDFVADENLEAEKRIIA